MQEIQPLRTGSMSRPSPRHMSSAPSPRSTAVDQRKLTLSSTTSSNSVHANSTNDIAAAAAAAAAEVEAEDGKDALTFM
jgi:hypothetical protein